MRFLVPAASAALIAAVTLSAAASVPDPPTRPATTTPPTTPPTTPTSAEPASTTWRTGATGALRTGATGPPVRNTTGVASLRGFVWPLSPRPAVLRRFEQPLSQWSSGHRGVDLSAAVGQPVLSAGDGVVSFSGTIAGRGVITVTHSGGLRTTYEPVDQRLAFADVVHRGDPIGAISSTPGHCVPLTCLHWGVVARQRYLDPLSLLGLGRPILLPLG